MSAERGKRGVVLRTAEAARAFMQTPEARERFKAAQRDGIRATERQRIADALRHHGHVGDGTCFYEAADFIERRLG